MTRTCFRCGATATARDHAIPRCFFPDSKPSTLRTVPSCRPCNEGVQADEEYVRDRLAASFLRGGREKLWGRAFRSLQRTEARGKAKAFSVDVSPVESPVIFGSEPIQYKIRLDKTRSNRIFEKIVRAHYFLWTDHRMDDARFHFELPTSAGYPRKRYDYAEGWVRKAASKRTHMITYGGWNWVSWAKGPDSEVSGVWLIGLLNTHVVLGFTMPKSKVGGRITLAQPQLMSRLAALCLPILTGIMRPHRPVLTVISSSDSGRPAWADRALIALFCHS